MLDCNSNIFAAYTIFNGDDVVKTIDLNKILCLYNRRDIYILRKTNENN